MYYTTIRELSDYLDPYHYLYGTIFTGGDRETLFNQAKRLHNLLKIMSQQPATQQPVTQQPVTDPPVTEPPAFSVEEICDSECWGGWGGCVKCPIVDDEQCKGYLEPCKDTCFGILETLYVHYI